MTEREDEPRAASEPAPESPARDPEPRSEAAKPAAAEPLVEPASEPAAAEPSPGAAGPAEAGPAPAPPPASAVAPAPRAPAAKPAPWAEPPETSREVPARWLAASSRRDFLLFAAGLLAVASGTWLVLPPNARRRLLPPPAHDALDTIAARTGLDPARRERLLDRALTFDDDVAEALYSPDRRVRTYSTSQVTPLRNNYDGGTPSPAILERWALQLSGLASGRSERLTLAELQSRFTLHGQVTRFVCVEGWSAIAWWGGIRCADFLAAFPPATGARWAAFRSDVNIDRRGNPDPYYVSIDLVTMRHPQVLLATHYHGRPLPMAHGAPLRLLAPVKLGLKNIKAITSIAYTASEPPDYWNERGYSKYDGI
jgi:DMSO/TMAO reductase YedYZ molybdopterin-dependent catalytic subunit